MERCEEEQALQQTNVYIAQVHRKFYDMLAVVFASLNHFKIF